MARVKRAVHGTKHHRAVLEQAQGYYGNKSRSYRAANEQVMHSLQYAYRDRRARKGDFRKLWIQRINAAARRERHELQPAHRRPAPGRGRGRPQDPRRPRGAATPRPSAPLVEVAAAGATATADQADEADRGRLLSQALALRAPAGPAPARGCSRKRSARRAERAFVAEGAELARGGAARPACPSRRVYRRRRGRDDPAVVAGRRRARRPRCPVFELGPGVIERVADTVTPQPLLAVVGHARRAARRRSAGADLVVVLRRRARPRNVGAVLRTRRRGRRRRVVCCGGTVDPYNPKTVRASAGSLFHVPLVVAGEPAEALEALGRAGFRRVGDRRRAAASDYADVDLRRPAALVLGNEAAGLPRRPAPLDGAVTIPMAGGAESLNVADGRGGALLRGAGAPASRRVGPWHDDVDELDAGTSPSVRGRWPMRRPRRGRRCRPSVDVARGCRRQASGHAGARPPGSSATLDARRAPARPAGVLNEARAAPRARSSPSAGRRSRRPSGRPGSPPTGST